MNDTTLSHSTVEKAARPNGREKAVDEVTRAAYVDLSNAGELLSKTIVHDQSVGHDLSLPAGSLEKIREARSLIWDVLRDLENASGD